MTLIIYYVSMLLAGDVVAALLCLLIELYSPTASLPIFIGLYFLILWAAWVLAVRLTEPKVEQAKSATPLPVK